MWVGPPQPSRTGALFPGKIGAEQCNETQELDKSLDWLQVSTGTLEMSVAAEDLVESVWLWLSRAPLPVAGSSWDRTRINFIYGSLLKMTALKIFH